MTENIAVVKPYYATGEAYNMGYRRFSGIDGDETEDFDLSPFKSSAEWANNVAPSLRSMAGYDDGGHGTYAHDRQVAAIEAGAEEDEPAEATLTRASYLFSELVEAYDRGAYDAASGRDPDPDRI